MVLTGLGSKSGSPYFTKEYDKEKVKQQHQTSRKARHNLSASSVRCYICFCFCVSVWGGRVLERCFP